jgi:hypothetical protein
MKTSALFILFALLSFQPLLSQNYHPFPDTNATWCDERSDNGMPTNYFYFFYKTNGKSNINDTVYTVVSDNYGEITCYFREENKKVFCRLSPDQPEFLMYNFDLEIGDSVSLPGNAVGFVEEADSILIGTEYHKRYSIQCYELHTGHFIEGVGSDQGLMYFNIPQFDIWGNLYCFSLNDTIYKTDGTGDTYPGDCWQYIGISETSAELMEIYPNPVRDFIHLKYDKDCRIELIDLTGRQCRQSTSNSIYVKDLKQGIYFLKVYSLKGRLLNQFKIVKLNER